MDVRFSGEVEVRGVDGGREFAGYHGLTRSAIECGGRVGGVCGVCVWMGRGLVSHSRQK